MFNPSALIAARHTISGGIINLFKDFPLLFEATVWVSAILFVALYNLRRFLKLTKWLNVPFQLVIFLTITNAWFFGVK